LKEEDTPAVIIPPVADRCCSKPSTEMPDSCANSALSQCAERRAASQNCCSESKSPLPSPWQLRGDPSRLLMLLVHLVESQSQHPIAVALRTYTAAQLAEGMLSAPLEVHSFNSIPGFGVTGLFKIVTSSGELAEIAVSIGSWEFMRQVTKDGEAIARWQHRMLNEQQSGRVVFFVSLDKVLVGCFVVADGLKPESAEVIRWLHHAPVNIGILSGDATQTVAAVAAQLGPDIPLQVHAELPPDQKAAMIRTLQEAGELVGFVGDGINDAAALSQANLGLAPAEGTDLAMSSADVILLKNNLFDVVIAADLAGFTMKIIKLNIMWGILYNCIAMPIALGLLWPLGIVIPPSLAGFAELFSSIPVILFSLYIKRYRAPTLFAAT
jgi:cation transport ATPase